MVEGGHHELEVWWTGGQLSGAGQWMWDLASHRGKTNITVTNTLAGKLWQLIFVFRSRQSTSFYTWRL